MASTPPSSGDGLDPFSSYYSDHLAVQSQEDDIRAAIALSQPLIGAKEPFTALQEAYADNPNFLLKLQTGASRYSHVRRVRGDGNCFYRSLLFALLEFALLPPPSISPLRHYQLVSAFYAEFIAAPTAITTSGVYSDFVVEDFYEKTKELVDVAVRRTLDQQGKTPLDGEEERSIRSASLAQLEAQLSDEDSAPYPITWLRCLTSFQLQSHAAEYEPYLVEHASVKAFCTAEVDGINHEVDAVQILALTSQMKVAVRIEYLDNSDGPLTGYVIPEGKEPLVTVLYRPGHYDIIYAQNTTKAAEHTAAQRQGGTESTERKEATGVTPRAGMRPPVMGIQPHCNAQDQWWSPLLIMALCYAWQGRSQCVRGCGNPLHHRTIFCMPIVTAGCFCIDESTTTASTHTTNTGCQSLPSTDTTA